VKEWNHQIIFLRKIIAGSAEKSYGIQVARLAGLPESVIARSKEVLAQLESGTAPTASAAGQVTTVPSRAPKKRRSDSTDQLDLFG